MRYAYDDEADALYIYVQEGATVASTTVVDEGRSVDLASDGSAVGIEITAASMGVLLLDLVPAFGLEESEAHLRPIEAQRFTAVA